MQTKAELEAEITRLRERVAELEGAVAAYQYALAYKDTAIPSPYYTLPNTGWYEFPNVVTTPNTFPATYNVISE